ncbi:ferritin-like domain-containing protein [Hymenobacter psoromatis]|uniref:ferritin-like domain-containing protein n=1 Tax=Hymenobacter psoromatis TaxID=1484116 RepID=UPI001CBF5F13|nr:ferritin-like domain-containing protein [Hymenobacter psoromatis]
MDFFQILNDISKVDTDVYDRFDTRRQVFKHMGGLGKKVTAATLPALLSTVFTKAYGQTTTALPQIIIDTLNLALSLEYLEFYYYSQGVTSGLFTGNDLNAISIIRDDEQGHINALKMVLGAAAIPDPTPASYDYTAGGNLTPFASAAMYLGTSQGFVDTGVRAYKGGAANLIGDPTAGKAILTAALNIHSVEARHSSHIRSMRRGYSTGTANTNGTGIVGLEAGGPGNLVPKSWLSLQENGGPAPTKTVANLGGPAGGPLTAAVYAAGTDATKYPADDNVMQAGINVQTNATAPAGLTITTAAASEAFDEPLDAAAVKAIARNFITPLGQSKGLFA